MRKIAIFASLLVLLLIISGCNFAALLGSTGTITGTVKDKATGIVLSGVNVTVNGTTYSAPSDANGNFSFATLPFGSYTLTATKDGYKQKEVAVSHNTPTTTVIIEMECNTDSSLMFAKQLVTDVKTSLFDLGDIAMTEESVVNQHFNETYAFLTNMTPYLNDVAMGLYDLEVMMEMPGTYIFDTYDEWGHPIFVQDPNYPSEMDGQVMSWTVEDLVNKLTVSITVPDLASLIVFDENDSSVYTVNLAGAYALLEITPKDPNSSATYRADLTLGSENIREYTFTETNYDSTLNGKWIIKVPTNDMVTASALIEPDDDNTFDGIAVDATFDLEDLGTDKKFTLDGTVSTPVFTYTGEMSITLKGLAGSNFEVNAEYNPPFTLNGNGQFVNDYFELSGNFNADFIIKEYTYDDGWYSYTYVEPLLKTSQFYGKYQSATTVLDGSVNFDFINAATYDESSTNPADMYANINTTINGSITSGSKFYTLNLTVTTPAMYDYLLTTAITTHLYALNGKVVMDDGALTEIALEHANGMYIAFDTAMNSPIIGGIYKAKGSTENYANILLVTDPTLGSVISVNFTDGTSIILPLNPTAYVKK